VAGSQTLRFDIVGDASSASRAFKQTADSAALAARGAKQFSDSLGLQSKSAQASADATLALAKSDSVLRDAQRTLAGATDDAAGSLGTLRRRLDELQGKTAAARVTLEGDKEAQARLDAIDARLVDLGHKTATPDLDIQGVAKATAELSAVDVALDKVGGKGGSAAGAASSLGLLASPMGAAVAAGAALSPVLVTAGVGLAGFGGAAVAAVKPILAAAQATGGLQGNLQTLNPAQQQAAKGLLALEDQYNAFSKALAPEVFSAFNSGLKIASTLLHDAAPVAASAGKGLDSVLVAVDADLNSAQWKQFFTWMAQNAGPDIQLLGTSIGAVADDLPVLLENLQPVGVALLNVTTAGAKGFGLLDRSVGKIEDDFAHLGDSVDSVGVKLKIPAGNRSILSLAEQWLGVGKAADAAVTAQQQAAAAQKAAVTAATDLSTNLTALESRYGLTASQAEALVTAAGQSDKALQGSGSSASDAVKAIEKYADASLGAQGPSQQLAAAISTLDNNTLGATVQLDAFTAAWNIIVGNSVSDQQAVLNTAQAFENYNSTVKTSGQTSTAAQQAFLSIITAMGTGLSTLQKNGATVGQLNSFYQDNISKLNALHGLTPQQRADVQGITRDYDTWAGSTQGLNSKLLTAAGTIKDSFTANLKALGEFTPQVQGDVDRLSNSILKTGTTSSATRGDRAALIKDLENAGIDADSATKMVDGLERKIAGLKGKTVGVNVVGSGSGKITFAEQNIKNAQTGFLEFHAAGGLIKGGTPGKDSVLGMLMPGEVVVPAAMVQSGAVDHLRGQLPGFAAGGLVGPYGVLSGVGQDFMGSAMNQAGQAAETAAAQAMIADIQAKVAAAAAAAAQVAAGPGGGTASANAALAKKLYPQYASGPVWDAWNYVAMRESGWNQFATNPSSGAYGIPQALPFTKMPRAAWPASAGGSSNPTAQIEWMWNYMAATYGGPIGAADHERQYNWYGNGLNAVVSKPTLIGVGERGPEHVQVTPVVPGRGTGGDVHVHLENHGIIGSQQEMRNWLQNEVDNLARDGRLRYALQQSPSARG